MKQNPPYQRAIWRITGALFFSQSMMSAAVIAAFTLSPIIAAELGGTERAAGLPSTLVYVGRALMAYPIGWLLDRIGRRYGLSLSFFIGVAGALLSMWAVVAGSLPAFLAGAVLLGMMRSGAEQGRFVAAEVQTAARRARVIGLVVSAGTVGSIFGPLLVDPAARLGLTLNLPESAGPFVVAAAFLLAAMLALLLLLRPDPLTLARQRTPPAAPPARPLRQVFASRTVRLAVLAMVIGQLVMSTLMVITPLYMHQHDQSTRLISWVIMAHTLGMFGLSGLTGWLIDRVGRLPMIVAGSLVLISAAVIAPLSPAFLPLALALFLLGLGWNFCYVAGSSLLSDSLATNERGRTQGASEMMVAVGAGAGSLGSGLIFDAGGITSVASLALALAGGLLLITLWVIWPRRLATKPLAETEQ